MPAPLSLSGVKSEWWAPISATSMKCPITFSRTDFINQQFLRMSFPDVL